MLTTVESARQYLGKPDDDVADDDLLLELCRKISERINSRLSRKLEAADYVEYIKGDGSNKIMLKQWPVNTVASIYDDVNLLWPISTKKDASTIKISDEVPGQVYLNGDVFMDSGIFSAYEVENIKVSYNAGYEADDMPLDIEQAANKLVAVEYMKSKGIMVAIKGMGDPKTLIEEAWEELEPYRKVAII